MVLRSWGLPALGAGPRRFTLGALAAAVSSAHAGCAHGIVVDLDFSAGGSGGASTATGAMGGSAGFGGWAGAAQAGSAGKGGSSGGRGGSSGSSGAGGSAAGGDGSPFDASAGGRADGAVPDVVEVGAADAGVEASRDVVPDVFCAGGGTALSFDGVSSRVTIPGAALPIANKARTVEMWMKVKPAAPDWSANHTVFEYGGDGAGEAFAADMDAFPMMELYAHPAATSLFFATGVTQETWFHFAATYDGTTMRAFIGGVEKGSKAMTAALVTTMTTLNVGGANGRKYFSGSIDELRVWSAARTVDEIKSTMSVRLTGSEPGLVGYWRFDEGMGATARDATAGGHNATLVGTTLPAWGPSGVTLGCP